MRATELTLYTFDGYTIRNLIKEDGSIWFVANGVLQPTSVITPKGQKWLYNRMLKHFNRAA